jgi:hypothetical protein
MNGNDATWSNGGNNGANFRVKFLDTDNQLIYVKEISGFLTGNFAFSLRHTRNGITFAYLRSGKSEDPGQSTFRNAGQY